MSALLETAVEAAGAGGQVLLSNWRNLPHGSVEEKKTNDFVTHADRESEEKIIAAIRGRYPGDAFLAEEGGADRFRFNGYDPVNYDMMCGPGSTQLDIAETYQGTRDSEQKYDYILSNGGRVLAWITGGGSPMWASYGISVSSTAKSDHSSADPHYGPPDWSDQHPFQTTEFLPPGVGGSWGSEYWALANSSDGVSSLSLELQNPPSHAGGSVTGADCALHPGEAVIAFWKNS